MHRTLLCVVSFLAFVAMDAQLDDQGWTVLNPEKASKIIYVSSSDGDDNQGVSYDYPNAAIGSDPTSPSGSIKAFRTVPAAEATLTPGTSAWILLKRGDVFRTGIRPKSGKSKDAPLVYHSYGSQSKSPLLETATEAGILFKKGNLAHVRVVGLSFYAETRDPDNAAFRGKEGEPGIILETNKQGAIKDILLEGNQIVFYGDNIIQSWDGRGTVTDISVRRNVILDNYASFDKANSIGLYTKNVDGMLLEENIFDHNGWLIRSDGDSFGTDRTKGQATMYAHNTYFVNAKNMVFRKNSFNRPSSIANKWVAKNGRASSENIVIEDNFYNDYEIMISMGNNFPEDSYRFKNIKIDNNVAVHPGRTDPTRRKLAWGLTLNDWDKGNFTNNIMTAQTNVAKSGFGIRVDGETRDVALSSNIFYDLKDSRGLLVNQEGAYDRVKIEENEFSFFENFKKYVYSESTDLNGLQFSKNTYGDAEIFGRPFQFGSNQLSFEQWQSQVGEQADASIPDYPDPTRDLDRYVSEVLGLANLDQYYAELRKQSYFNWRTEYTGSAIASWIRAGFRHTGSTPPDSDTVKNYRFLRLVPTGSVSLPPYVKELKWYSEGQEYPKTKVVKGSERITATVNQNPAFRAYDGANEGGWASTTNFPQSITIELQDNLEQLPDQLAITVNGKRRNFSGFECWASEDGTNFEKFYEVSGLSVSDYGSLTTTFDLNGGANAAANAGIGAIRSDLDTDRFTIYPNPSANEVHFNREFSGSLYDRQGQVLKTFLDAGSLDISSLSAGIYFIKNTAGETRKLIVE